MQAPDQEEFRFVLGGTLTLLKSYLDQRVAEYQNRNREELRQIEAKTARLQNEMWSTVTAPATVQPTPIAALVLAGMNDVLNSQGYAQAAWWNRIPTAAWMLMIIISIFYNLLIGFSSHGK